MVAAGASLKYDAWEQLLPVSDPQRNFLLNGIKNGFNVLDVKRAHAVKLNKEVNNYRSATDPTICNRVETQIRNELANFRYKVVTEKPVIVSALGAIPKSNGDYRLIHDASRPSGQAVNDFWEKEPFQYQTIQDAVDIITPGCYMAKVDLESAYRCVRTHESNHPFLGLKWTFQGDDQPTYMTDTRLPFGVRRAPYIFNEISQAVRRIMRSRGFDGVIVMLDDFLVIHETYQGCLDGLNELMRLVRCLGFAINYNKILMPSKRVTFLGVDLDSESMTLELPKGKIDELYDLLVQTSTLRRITKRELQSLAGKLNFACQCVYGGRFFVRRLHDAIARLRLPWHRTRITNSIRDDIAWWTRYLTLFNGWLPMMDPRPLAPIYTDACKEAAGAVWGNSFVHVPWTDWAGCAALHINFKETIAVEIALNEWAPLLRDHKVRVHCDNVAAVGILNKGTSRNPRVMASLRNIFWLSATFNFKLEAVHISGSKNILADTASRLHERNILLKNQVCIFSSKQDRVTYREKLPLTATLPTLQIPTVPTTYTVEHMSDSVESTATRWHQ